MWNLLHERQSITPFSGRPHIDDKWPEPWHDTFIITSRNSKLQPIELVLPDSDLITCAKRMLPWDDPSTFVSLSAAYDVITRCDEAIQFLDTRVSTSVNVSLDSRNIVATAITGVSQAIL